MNSPETPGDRNEPPPRPPRVGRRAWFWLFAVVAVAGLGAALRFSAPADSPGRQTAGMVTSAASDTIDLPHRVIAYYFHTNYRCSSCRKIEAYTRRAMDTGFAQELADGRLVWRVVNVEEDGNGHFVKDYELYTKSVILSDEQSGREVRWKNLAKVWELLGDEAGFVDYVQTETRVYLGEAR